MNSSNVSPDRILRRNEAFRSRPIPAPKPILSGNSITAVEQPISSQPDIVSADYSHLSNLLPQVGNIYSCLNTLIVVCLFVYLFVCLFVYRIRCSHTRLQIAKLFIYLYSFLLFIS